MTDKSQNSQNRTIGLILGSIILGVLLLFWLAHVQQLKEDEKARRQLESEVTRQILLYKNGETNAIDLSKISSFSWDKLYIFGPYTPLSIIQKRLGYSWEPSLSTMLGVDTPFNLLVFTFKGEVVRYVDYPRSLGEFSNTGEGAAIGYDPQEAVFIINEYGYIKRLGE